MKKKTGDLELRRLETIYKTFVKMDNKERKRVLDFMISRFYQDLKTKIQ